MTAEIAPSYFFLNVFEQREDGKQMVEGVFFDTFSKSKTSWNNRSLLFAFASTFTLLHKQKEILHIAPCAAEHSSKRGTQYQMRLYKSNCQCLICKSEGPRIHRGCCTSPSGGSTVPGAYWIVPTCYLLKALNHLTAYSASTSICEACIPTMAP